MTGREMCDMTDCSHPSALRLEERPLCIAHFIAVGYERIDECTRAVSDHRFQETGAESLWQFLVECIEHAADLTQQAEQLDNLQRARLFDILLRAADLSRHLRRSPRRETSVPVLLRCEKLGRAWEEKTQTRVLSRYGAMLTCNHPAEKGDPLTLVRLDTGEETKARVAWRKQG